MHQHLRANIHKSERERGESRYELWQTQIHSQTHRIFFVAMWSDRAANCACSCTGVNMHKREITNFQSTVTVHTAHIVNCAVNWNAAFITNGFPFGSNIWPNLCYLHWKLVSKIHSVEKSYKKINRTKKIGCVWLLSLYKTIVFFSTKISATSSIRSTSFDQLHSAREKSIK